jgi:hypothetical protein
MKDQEKDIKAGFPKVTDTPPMPKVKDPKPETGFRQGEHEGTLRCNTCGSTRKDPQGVDDCDIAKPSTLPHKEVISIQPGDVVLIKFNEVLGKERNDRTEKAMSGLFPHNSVLILDNGASLEVYR